MYRVTRESRELVRKAESITGDTTVHDLGEDKRIKNLQNRLSYRVIRGGIELVRRAEGCAGDTVHA